MGGQGRVEPPNFRFSAGIAGPGQSTTGHLIGTYSALVASCCPGPSPGFHSRCQQSLSKISRWRASERSRVQIRARGGR